MKPSIERKLQVLQQRFQALQEKLSSVEVTKDVNLLQKLSKESHDLAPIIEAYDQYNKQKSQIDECQAMLEGADEDLQLMIKEEKQDLESALLKYQEEVCRLLLPKDPDDDKNIYLEIRSGTGGDEASLFCGDLLRMYQLYSQQKRWKFDIMQISESEKGGCKEVVVHVKDLVHTYDAAKPAVDCVSLDIYRGEFVAVVGQNGCGKTTLVKHLNGLHAPTRGTVEILGKDTKDWTLSDLGKKVGFVFQNPDHQIFADTIREEVAFGPYNYGLSETETEKKVSHALDIVGLAGREAEDPFSLTKGERQQLALASVLATDPEVLILDEPTTGLDYHGQTAILNLIRKLNESGRTVIIITHSMWVVAEYADRCIMMSQGKIVKDSDIRTCFKDMDLLESLHLEAPEAVRIGHAFGMTVRSVDELVACLVKSARR